MRLHTVDLSGSDAANALDAALRADGFVQLIGHGIDPGATEALRSGIDHFFDLPIATKRRYVIDDPLANRGYRGRGSESLAYALGQTSPPDLFESFNFGHPDRQESPLMAPTPWPEEAPGFVAAAREYLAAMAGLSMRIDELLGALIGLDLALQSCGGPDTMACIRYQRGSDEDHAEPSQQRMGAHSDYTSFTILSAEPVPGLEILAPEGWQGVTPDPGALLMNVGDLLAMWTNDAWPSTVHRVPILGGARDPEVRRTIAYFHYPDLGTAVEPLPGFGPPRYASVTVDEHLAAMLIGPKIAKPSTGASTLGDRRT